MGVNLADLDHRGRRGRSYRLTSASISSLRADKEKAVSVDELAPGDVRWFRGGP